jgi:hypothetical protein
MASSFELEEARKWFEIRDLLLGENYFKRDVKRALELAAACKHPDAQWLVGMLAEKDFYTQQEMHNIFLSSNDARALCFAALLSELPRNNTDLVRRSAEMGYAFAQAMCVAKRFLSFIVDFLSDCRNGRIMKASNGIQKQCCKENDWVSLSLGFTC